MNIIMDILACILVAFFVIVFLWLPYSMTKNARHLKKARPEFEALYRKVENSTSLDRKALIELYNEIVNWYKENYLFWKDVELLLSYIRGRLNMSVTRKKGD